MAAATVEQVNLQRVDMLYGDPVSGTMVKGHAESAL